MPKRPVKLPTADTDHRGSRQSVGLIFFFFQAEDGIRDYKVTGVQTCALPISDLRSKESPGGVYVTPPVDSVCPKVIATSAFIRSLTCSITATGTGAPPLKTTFNVVGLYCSNAGCWSMAISMVGTAKIYSQFSCLMTCSVLSGSKASKGCSVILPTIAPAAMPAPAIWKNGRGIQ